MADLPYPAQRLTAFGRLDKALLAVLIILVTALIAAPGDFLATVGFASKALAQTAPLIVFAVGAVAFLKATGAESLLAAAFVGHPARMIIMGAMLGGLSPFCSCEVIPFIGAMLSMGVPLPGVMAFWLASPLMDPAMFTITVGELGWDFAIAKTIAAVAVGMMGGGVVWTISKSSLLKDPLRASRTNGCGCGAAKPFSGKPVWRFWSESERRHVFLNVSKEQTWFLGKWLALAYVIEAIMVLHLPADWIATALGGDGIWTIVSAAVLGAPAYLNGYVAASLLGGLVEQGMGQGAAMSFMIAGGVTSIPAAVAVAALVKTRILVLYLCLGIVGAITAGMAWSVIG